MDALTLIYNVLLLVLYCMAFLIAGLFYIQTKKTIYLYVGVLFFFYSLDNLIIYMTEFVASFSHFYDTTFMSVPTLKTIIFLVTFWCMVKINSIIIHREHSRIFESLLILLGVILLFIPIMEDSAMKVWLYYFPCQVFTFALGNYGLRVLKKENNAGNIEPEVFKRYRKLLLWCVIFSVLIVIEDTIVIFNFDVYSDIMVKINNRSITEDIMSIGQALYAIVILSRLIHIVPATSSFDDSNKNIISADTSAPAADMQNTAAQSDIAEADTATIPTGTGEIVLPESISEILPGGVLEGVLEAALGANQYSKFYLFCREYQLTTREQDILTLMLENKNNQEISDELMISLGTAKTHAHNIFQKLGVTKRRQLLEAYEEYTPHE